MRELSAGSTYFVTPAAQRRPNPQGEPLAHERLPALALAFSATCNFSLRPGIGDAAVFDCGPQRRFLAD
jgi:hypothetical protein